MKSFKKKRKKERMERGMTSPGNEKFTGLEKAEGCCSYHSISLHARASLHFPRYSVKSAENSCLELVILWEMEAEE